MNYELAKQLKDAGFPQEAGYEYNVRLPGGERVTIPSLSVLIEACGDKFVALRIVQDTLWEAIGKGDDYDFGNVGDTPKKP